MRTFKQPWRFLFFILALSGLSGVSAAQSSEASISATPARAADALVALGTQVKKTALDCSHFVNSLFAEAGLYYKYEPSRVLYRGTDAFRRVNRPSSGDLIVWPGHVGIVVDPDQKTFVSALTRGVRISSYTSSYWKHRGRARFFHYRLMPAGPTLTWQASIPDNQRTLSNSGLE
jgi:cell wall-associated NlpC family hydrolase